MNVWFHYIIWKVWWNFSVKEPEKGSLTCKKVKKVECLNTKVWEIRSNQKVYMSCSKLFLWEFKIGTYQIPVSSTFSKKNKTYHFVYFVVKFLTNRSKVYKMLLFIILVYKITSKVDTGLSCTNSISVKIT